MIRHATRDALHVDVRRAGPEAQKRRPMAARRQRDSGSGVAVACVRSCEMELAMRARAPEHLKIQTGDCRLDFSKCRHGARPLVVADGQDSPLLHNISDRNHPAGRHTLKAPLPRCARLCSEFAQCLPAMRAKHLEEGVYPHVARRCRLQHLKSLPRGLAFSSGPERTRYGRSGYRTASVPVGLGPAEGFKDVRRITTR
jgi:hypothetical protein